MTDVSLFSFLIKGPGEEEETLEELIEPSRPHHNIVITKIQET